MKDEFLSLFEAAKDLVDYIDKEHVLTKPLTWDVVVLIPINLTPFTI